MQLAGKTEWVDQIRTAREADREVLRGASRAAGGPREMLLQRYPALGESCPQSWSEAQLVAQTEAGYDYAERRLQACARCPETGGACHDEPSNLRAGVQPQWLDGELVLTEVCTKWRDYALGIWLQASGVPKNACRYTLGSYPGGTKARDAAVALWNEWVAGASSWLVLVGPHNSGKTHISVGLLRGLKLKRASRTLAYVNGATLRTALKRHFDDPIETASPLEQFRRADFSVIENVDPERWPSWLRDAVEETLQARREGDLPTLVTTRSAAELVKAFESVDFSGVPQCRLAR